MFTDEEVMEYAKRFEDWVNDPFFKKLTVRDMINFHSNLKVIAMVRGLEVDL